MSDGRIGQSLRLQSASHSTYVPTKALLPAALIVAFAVPCLAATPPSDMALAAFQACARSEATRLEPSGEPASVIAVAAVDRCERSRAAAVAYAGAHPEHGLTVESMLRDAERAAAGAVVAARLSGKASELRLPGGAAVTEFGAVIVGALVAGVISLVGQWMIIGEARQERRAARDDRNTALAASLAFKLALIYSHIESLRKKVLEIMEEGRRRALPEPWQFARPLTSYPERVNFSPDEMAMLVRLKDDKLVNELLILDEQHNALISTFELLGKMRTALFQSLPADMKEEMLGTVELDAEQKRLYGPKMAEINELFGLAFKNAKAEAPRAQQLLIRTTTLLVDRVGLPFGFRPLPAQADGPVPAPAAST